MGLGDYLIKPVQRYLGCLVVWEGLAKGQGRLTLTPKYLTRICKYPLLFKGLLELTSQDSTEWKSLKVACDTIDAVAVLVNKNKAVSENTQRVKEIADSLDDGDVRNYPHPPPTSPHPYSIPHPPKHDYLLFRGKDSILIREGGY